MHKPLSLLLCLIAGVAQAASPRDELLRLAPPDAGFVVVVQNLRDNVARWQTSPWVAKLRQTAAGRAILDQGLGKAIAEINRELLKEVGQPWATLRDDVLGDAVVFVYRPGPPDKPEAEEGLVLVHTRDPQTAASVFEQLDKQQQKAGKLKSVTTVTYGERTYRRRERTDEPVEFQYQNGPLLVFGSSEKMLRQVIDAERASATQPPALVEQFKKLGVDAAAAVWWVNPRAFDAAMAANAKKATGPEAFVHAALIKHWQAVDAAALYFDVNHDTRLGLALACRAEALPPATRLFFTEWSKPSALLAAFPEDALLTLTGRVALPPLLDMGRQFLPDAAQAEVRATARKTLGAALGEEVLAVLPERLGPDWGVCVAPPREGDSSPWPSVTAAVRLADNNAPPVAPSVLNGLNAVATLAVIGYNAKHPEPLSPRTEKQADVEVRYFAGGNLPVGLRPAYAWKSGYLVFASSPECIARFTPPRETPITDGETPMLKVALRGWSQYLRQHRNEAKLIVTGPDGEQRIANLAELLDLFDGLDLSVRGDAGRSVVTVRVR